MNRRVCVLGLVVTLAAISVDAVAQTHEHLSLELEGRTIGIDGGERANTGASTGPVVVGRTRVAFFSKMTAACGFHVSTKAAPDGAGGWEASMTPVAVNDDVITARVEWRRLPGTEAGPLALGSTLEVKLRPGESFPLDLVAVPPSLAYAYERCGVRAVMLRVAARYNPRRQDDRRLVLSELWLLERFPNGTEQARALQVRGLVNDSTAFYFDTITDGGSALDFYGQLHATLLDGGFNVRLEVRSRVIDGNQASINFREANSVVRGRQVTTDVRVSPGEVVSVELPRLGETDSGAFAGRQYSVRLRIRQIR